LGDVFFSLINYARFLGLNPDEALERTNRKFIFRFNYMEEKVFASGKTLSDLKLTEMDQYWEDAKKLESK
jgi:XTP/dITP diphosphohydrolase